jgi:uncharacterized iron-regulated membrane protein
MVTTLLLFDVPADPTSTALGLGALIVIGLVVLALASLMIGGLVFLLVWRKRRKTATLTAETVNLQRA